MPFMERERAERIQLVPQHTVCLCLQHYPGYVYQGGGQNCGSFARARARRAQGRPRKRAAAIKRRAGVASPLMASSGCRAHPSLPLARLCDRIYVGRSLHLWAIIQDFKGTKAARLRH